MHCDEDLTVLKLEFTLHGESGLPEMPSSLKFAIKHFHWAQVRSV